MSHTPGPWVAFYKHKYDEWHVSIPISGSTMKRALFDDGIRSENAKEDARLIAAGPEMLAALMLLLESGASFYPGAIESDSSVALDFEAWEGIARAAIAKATGE